MKLSLLFFVAIFVFMALVDSQPLKAVEDYKLKASSSALNARCQQKLVLLTLESCGLDNQCTNGKAREFGIRGCEKVLSTAEIKQMCCPVQ